MLVSKGQLPSQNTHSDISLAWQDLQKRHLHLFAYAPVLDETILTSVGEATSKRGSCMIL